MLSICWNSLNTDFSQDVWLDVQCMIDFYEIYNDWKDKCVDVTKKTAVIH